MMIYNLENGEREEDKSANDQNQKREVFMEFIVRV
jgi:hypothetical protein